MQESYENTPHISVSQCMNCSQVFVEFPYHRKHHEFRGGWIPGWELRPDRYGDGEDRRIPFAA